MTGRKAKPASLKILRMTAKKADRLVARQLETPGDLKDAPDWFTPAQRGDWDYAIANAPRDVLRKIDKAVLAAFIVAADVHRQASMALQSTALLVKTPAAQLLMQNPYLPIINRQMLLMIRAAAELGFTPCSRARIESGRPPAEPMGDWDEVPS